MTVNEELNTTIRFYWNAIIFYIVTLVTLYFSPILTAIIVGLLLILVIFPLVKLYRLRKNPALFLAEVQRFCKTGGKCKCQQAQEELG